MLVMQGCELLAIANSVNSLPVIVFPVISHMLLLEAYISLKCIVYECKTTPEIDSTTSN